MLPVDAEKGATIGVRFEQFMVFDGHNSLILAT
jgi:hypothetical protein